MVRVTYKDGPDNSLVNSKPIIAETQTVDVTIFSDHSFWILSESKEELSKGQGKTLALAKKLVKDSLKGLGVVFQEEVRSRSSDKKVII